MYLPQHFAESRQDELDRLIENSPLGALVHAGSEGLDANHLPFFVTADDSGQRYLLAHVARANPLWQQVRDGDDVLVIFRAANAYISPNWYPSKHEFHRQVPTWNYQVLNVHGRITIRDDAKFVRAVVARLTHLNEQRAAVDREWKMTDSPKDYIEQMVSAIVGIEIAVTKMVGKWKLSQNREERDRVNAAEELRKRGHDELSAAMDTRPVERS